METTKPTRKRRRKPGDIATLRRVLWSAILAAEDLLDDPDPQVKLRAVHAVGQASAPYTKLLLAADVEARLLALETAMGEAPQTPKSETAALARLVPTPAFTRPRTGEVAS